MWKFKLPIFCKQSGFPASLSAEVARLQTAIDKAKRENLEPQFEPEVHDVIRDMISSMPFADKFRELGQVVQSYCAMQVLQSELAIEEGRRVDSPYFQVQLTSVLNSFTKLFRSGES